MLQATLSAKVMDSNSLEAYISKGWGGQFVDLIPLGSFAWMILIITGRRWIGSDNLLRLPAASTDNNMCFDQPKH